MNVLAWIRETTSPSETWLILGKGPSFSKIDKFDLSKYRTIALNHAALFCEAALNHYTDLEAFRDCSGRLIKSESRVVMPWVPHVENRPGKKNLSQLLQEEKSLRILYDRGLLLTYNSSLSRKKKTSLPTIRVKFFSAVAAFNILASAGVKKIRSLGVDGGTSYAKVFDRSDLLSNGRSDFNVQFQEIRRTADKHSIDYQML